MSSVDNGTPAAAPPVIPEFLQRWQSFLAQQSRSFASLKQEQQAGWQSPALDALYSAGNNGTSKRPAAEPPAAPGGGAKNEESTSALQPSAGVVTASPPMTHFKSVDVEQLCDRYRKHAREILLRTDSKLFGAAATTASAATAAPGDNASEMGGIKLFADLGCAPGGVSAFLALDQKWHGVGVSLPEQLGGIGMTRLLTAAEEVVQRERRFVYVEKSILDGDLSDVVAAAGNQLVSAPLKQRGLALHGFDFVNGGAVQDHGQRASDKETASSSSIEDGAPILPWFYFLAPQLLTALSVVRRDGQGAVMVVYGMSQCGSLFLLLHLLVEVLHIVPSYADVDFLETMHLTKPPIYLVLHHVAPTDEALEQLRRHFSWAECNASAGQVNAAECGDDECERRMVQWNAARAFWHLDDAPQRTAAEHAFAQCGAKLEVLWTRAEGYLRQRREKAERFVQNSASQQRKQVARGTLAKRSRV